MIAALLASLAVASEPLPRISLRLSPTGERKLVDSLGRERAFHGTNTIVKAQGSTPWIPSRGEFDGITSLTAHDFEYMRQAGLNIIRLGVMWAGAEPSRGNYNTTYLRLVREIADEAAS